VLVVGLVAIYIIIIFIDIDMEIYLLVFFVFYDIFDLILLYNLKLL